MSITELQKQDADMLRNLLDQREQPEPDTPERALKDGQLYNVKARNRRTKEWEFLHASRADSVDTMRDLAADIMINLGSKKHNYDAFAFEKAERITLDQMSQLFVSEPIDFINLNARERLNEYRDDILHQYDHGATMGELTKTYKINHTMFREFIIASGRKTRKPGRKARS